jgi:hypothetical protein
VQSRQAGGTDRRSRVATIVNSGDRDDANNYVSIDDYRASTSPWRTSTVLAQRWNAVHPDARVIVHGDSATRDAASNANAFTNCGVTRVFAALQLLGGGLEVIVAGGALLAPEPTGATKVLGAIVMLHGIDTLQASARTGPESLASARGWSILARTGLRPGQATEVILLPSAANSSFVVVQPMGIFSRRSRRDGHRISTMKPERIVLLVAWLLLAAGFMTWLAGGADLMASVGIWLWVGAAGTLGLPLLIWLVELIFRAVRR